MVNRVGRGSGKGKGTASFDLKLNLSVLLLQLGGVSQLADLQRVEFSLRKKSALLPTLCASVSFSFSRSFSFSFYVFLDLGAGLAQGHPFSFD